MSIDYQNLNEDRRHLSHARVWFRRKDWWQRRLGELCVSWTVPCSHCGWSIHFGDGDGGRDLGITLALPFILTLYLNFENFFAKRLFKWNFDEGDSREVGFYFHGGSIWWRFWVDPMASYGRGLPWCRWYRQGSFNFASLLGKMSYSCETLREGIPVQIRMPEGVYSGVAKVERRRWKRWLWLPRVQVSTWIEVEKGIPFQGKGESSWDCGDDGLFGAGHEGDDIELACIAYAESAMKSRRKYGQPSPSAIEQALAVS